MKHTDHPAGHPATRRAVLRGGFLALAGAAAGPLFFSTPSLSAQSPGDVNILNTALGLEHEAIAAYQLAAQKNLLQPDVQRAAVKFMEDHKVHRDTMVEAVKRLGGKPVEAKPMEEYAKSLKADALKSQKDVLELALRLETAAINAYLGVIPSFADRGLAKTAGRMAVDETVHWTTFNALLGTPLPKAMQFGA